MPFLELNPYSPIDFDAPVMPAKRSMPAWQVPGASKRIEGFAPGFTLVAQGDNVILPNGKIVNYLTPVLA